MTTIDPFALIQLYPVASFELGTTSSGGPVFRDDHEELLAQCLVAVERRENNYPELVAAGRMDADEANRDLAAWRDLVTEWRWILTGEGTLPSLETKADRIAAVELAADRLEAELARGRRSQANLYQHHLLEALHWHLQPGSKTHFYADLTRTLRAEQRAKSERKAA